MRGMSFIDRIKSTTPNLLQLWPNHVPLLVFHDTERGLLVPALEDGRILTHHEFGELITELTAFYNATTDQEIAEHNQQVERLSQERSAPAIFPPPPPIATPGIVYLVESGGMYKIGKTKNEKGRMRVLKIQLPNPATVIHTIPTSDIAWAEDLLHRTFAHCRLNGEWFALSNDEVRRIAGLSQLEPGVIL